MIILGIETSCDETSAALLRADGDSFEVLAHVLSSSVKEHIKYGGIIPEVAARKQIEYIIPVVEGVFDEAEIAREDIDAIAVTVGPGLVSSLQVGIDTAKTLAYAWQKPFIPINHLEGHLYSPLLDPEAEKLEFPAIALLVSGKHTDLVLVKNHLEYEVLGRTRDDAAGEAFDKVARLLGYPYPGGPEIAKLAQQGDEHAFDFPRGMIHSGDYDFSFSGIKTAVLYEMKKHVELTSELVANIAASFQRAVIDVLVYKSIKAVEEYGAKAILLGGGVAANTLLQKELIAKNKRTIATYHASPITFTGDNASMIAIAGYYRYVNNDYITPDPVLESWQTIKATPSLALV